MRMKVVGTTCVLNMTKLLDEAIAKVRELPEEEQERAAESLHDLRGACQAGRLQALGGGACGHRRSKAQVRRGELATDAEVEAAYARFRR